MNYQELLTELATKSVDDLRTAGRHHDAQQRVAYGQNDRCPD